MKLSTRARVVKSNTVEVCIPRLVECHTEEFQFLGEHISVVRDTTLSVPTEGEERPIFEILGDGTKAPQGGVKPGHEAKSTVRDWEAEAQAILSQAREEAQRLLAEAESSAQQLRDVALTEIEAFRQQVAAEATERGYQDGHAKGKIQGYEEGRTKGIEEAEALKQEAKALFQLAQRAVEEEFNKVDEALLRLALKVSERIVRANIKIHPETLVHRIRALSLLPQEREGWRLHVSPQDAEWLISLPPSEKLSIPLIRDDTLAPGDCFLECQEGIFDARLEAQLERFEHLLGEELKQEEFNNDGLEQAGR